MFWKLFEQKSTAIGRTITNNYSHLSFDSISWLWYYSLICCLLLLLFIRNRHRISFLTYSYWRFNIIQRIRLSLWRCHFPIVDPNLIELRAYFHKRILFFPFDCQPAYLNHRINMNFNNWHPVFYSFWYNQSNQLRLQRSIHTDY